MHLTRQEIDMYGSIILALNYRNLAEMEGQDDEAIYDLSRVLDNRHLRRRAISLVEFVQFSNFESIFSRRLWQNREFCKDVYSLMTAIDREVTKIERLEHEIVEMHEPEPEPEYESIDTIKIDKRWTEKTIPQHIRKRCNDVDGMTDHEILDYIGYYEVTYEDTGLSNKELFGSCKIRLMKGVD